MSKNLDQNTGCPFRSVLLLPKVPNGMPTTKTMVKDKMISHIEGRILLRKCWKYSIQRLIIVGTLTENQNYYWFSSLEYFNHSLVQMKTVLFENLVEDLIKFFYR